MNPDEVHEKYREAMQEHASSREEIIHKAFKENDITEVDLNRAYWDMTVIEGARTLMYDQTPIVTLWPLKMKREDEDGKVTVKMIERYLIHNEEGVEDEKT